MDKSRKLQFSLKENCRLRLKGMLEDLQRANKGVSQFLLITDANSLRILSSLMQMMELMQLNIFSVDLIENPRTAHPKKHAIYLLSCESDSVNAMLGDFKDKKSALYGRVHLFFLNRVSNELMTKISSNSLLLERVSTFKEFNQDFTCSFDNIISLDMKSDMKTLYSSKIAEFKLRTKEIGEKLATVIFAFEKLCAVEIVYNTTENEVSQLIAQAVHLRVNEVLKKLQSEKAEQYDQQAGKVTLLIVDRTFDVLTPLVRDFYYQPMLYDLLDKDIENDIITYKLQDDKVGKIVDKKAILNEKDDLFRRYRFQHIGEVMNGISEEFNKFVNSNSTAKMQMSSPEELDFKKMSEIVRSMPQYQELLSKYNLHMKLLEDCWSLFEKKDLKSVGEIEQSCATGLDISGDKIKDKLIISQISSRMQSDNLDDNDKLRLVLIAILTLELTDKQRKDLLQYLPSEKQRAIQNLVYLGVNPQKSGEHRSKMKKSQSKEALKKMKHRLQSQAFDLCRTAPELETLIDQMIAGFKSSGGQSFKVPINFKSLRINCDDNSGSAAKNVKSLAQKNRLANILGGNNNDDEAVSNSTSKFIVFVAGGISITEVRAVRTLVDAQQDQDFITVIGGTSFFSPNLYVEKILEMEDNIDL